VLWAYADAMAGKREVPSGGKPAPIVESARSALGCDGG
jgi:hypothetical protein